MKEVDSTNSSNLPCVVEKSHVPLGRGVKLSDLNVPKAIEKLPPNLCSDPVSDGQSHLMFLVIVFLHCHNNKKQHKNE